MQKKGFAVTIDGQEYEMLFTTQAAEDMSKRYGGLENISKMVDKSDFGKTIAEIAWAVVLLVNQGTLYYNSHHKDKPKPLMTEEDFKLWTEPKDFATFQDSLISAIRAGSATTIQSEADPKNAEVE